ncbi:hypothetical protein E2562_039038 [Oryza meyeriana var. granulata]|uniref:Chalcone/stilbene synthase N-terminal domain-containing protein n=1 Tax=Oryza meyeriana var. granulata TaxID=110450 RepID=A0A6G1CBH4_9ORYZ|nr:hypothetical protein E2562_039038 [Oryza meyeriana var. granulata]
MTRSVNTRSSPCVTSRRSTCASTYRHPPCRSSPRWPQRGQSLSGAAQRATSPTSFSPPALECTCPGPTYAWRSSSASAASSVQRNRGAAAALRVAKDIAENNRGARVLVASAELTLIVFHAPQESRMDNLVVQALFGDGVGAVVVGAGGDDSAVIPNSEDLGNVQLQDSGMVALPSPKLPAMVRNNVEQWIVEGVGPLVPGGGWNDLFWAVHPGGPAILDSVPVQDGLALAPGEAGRQPTRAE